MKKSRLLAFIFCTLFTSEQLNAQVNRDSFLFSMLFGHDPRLDEVLTHPEKYEFQLFYTPVDSSESINPFVTHSFHADQSYFYPASIIKLPVMAIALEKMTDLKRKGTEINLQTPFKLHTCSCDDESDSYVSRSSKPTIEQFMREMMIMSNNDAFNLFVDFVGMSHFNKRMIELSYPGICLKNRFVAGCGSKNKFFGGFTFQKTDSTDYSIPCDSLQPIFPTNNPYPVQAGRYHTENGRKTQGPKNYSASNFVRLSDIHDMMIQLFYPNKMGKPDFVIDESYKSSFLKTMGDFPRELKNTSTDYSKTADHYYKFFLDPETMKTREGGIRLYNKVGLAYGFLSDVTYFEDSVNNIRFFLSACILSKKDGWIGGGAYDYYDFGIPVLRNIGRIIYQYELNKK